MIRTRWVERKLVVTYLEFSRRIVWFVVGSSGLGRWLGVGFGGALMLLGLCIIALNVIGGCGGRALSFNWVMRVHKRVPLTLQEERVNRFLARLGLSYEPQKVFQLSEERLVVDFAVNDGGRQLIIECSYSGARHGAAIAALKRVCVYMDFRFAQLKASDPKLICLAFIEAFQVYGGELREVLKPILVHADGFAVSEEELGSELRRLLSSS